ncbi:hypothetical protein A1F99_142680 [Pyrenophora tritici-repentis]|nr:hypothetical protein A1F99_142680 [Pyrenophora tritici-repentis]
MNDSPISPIEDILEDARNGRPTSGGRRGPRE